MDQSPKPASDPLPIRLPIAALAPDPDNPRKMAPEALSGLGVSLETFGPLDIVFNDETGHLVSGHQRVRSLAKAGALDLVRVGDAGYIEHPKTRDRFPVRFVRWDSTKERMANLAANSPGLQGEFTEAALEQLRALEHDETFRALELQALESALAEQFKAAEQSGGLGGSSGALLQKFGIPPFTILDARQGYWKERKAGWLSLGIQSELGRSAAVAPAGGGVGSAAYQPVGQIGKGTKAARLVRPGGNARPACDYSSGKRGDGAGNPIDRQV
jgi:hypothetical protein